MATSPGGCRQTLTPHTAGVTADLGLSFPRTLSPACGRRRPETRRAIAAGSCWPEPEQQTADRGLQKNCEIAARGVDRASVTTFKRLNNEIRAMSRFRVAGPETPKQQEEEMRPGNDKHPSRATRPSIDEPQPGAVRPSNIEPQPLDDLTRQASLRRKASLTRQRIRALAAKALADPGPLVPLYLNLKPETARALRSTLAATRRNPHLVAKFSPDGSPVPEWVALLALLENFIEKLEVDLSARRPSS